MSAPSPRQPGEEVRLAGLPFEALYLGAVLAVGLIGLIGSRAVAASGGTVENGAIGWALLVVLLGIATAIRVVSSRRVLVATPARIARTGLSGSTSVDLSRLRSVTMTPDRPASPSVFTFGQARATLVLEDTAGSRLTVDIPLPFRGDAAAHAQVWRYVEEAIDEAALPVRPALLDAVADHAGGAPGWQTPPARPRPAASDRSAADRPGAAVLQARRYLLFPRAVATSLTVLVALLAVATGWGPAAWVGGVLLPAAAAAALLVRVRQLRLHVDAQRIRRDRLVGAPDRCDLTGLVQATQRPDRLMYGSAATEREPPVVTLVDVHGGSVRLSLDDDWVPAAPLWQHVLAAVERSTVQVGENLRRNLRYQAGEDPDAIG